jgi:ABC-2 type transport system permease protein
MNAEMKSVNQELMLAARQGLIPVNERTWLGGFGNMFRKELGQWWGTRTWWVQTIIWVLIINGITTITMVSDSFPPEEMIQEVVQTFLSLGAFAIGIGTITTVQGAIIGEKQLGTAAWVLSKPASRSSFILAKLIAYTIGYWITAILAPAAIFIMTTRQLIPAPLSLISFMVGVTMVELAQLFYLTLVLMLGTFYNRRGPIAGIGIAFIMTGLLLKGFIPFQVLIVTPWLLPDVASALALGTSLPSVWFVPIMATSFWIVIMTVVALWRFDREEF